jgi:YVTN family beta-propeller protein
MRKMKRAAVALAVVTGSALAILSTARIGSQADGSYLIPTGQILTPAGTHIEVNDRPLGMALSPDGRLLAVATGSNFAPRALHVIDLTSRTVAWSAPLRGSFAGVAFNADGSRLFVGGGPSDRVHFFQRDSGAKFREDGAVEVRGGAPSGLSLSADGTMLYVALNLKHSLGIVDLATRSLREVPVGVYPYTALADPKSGKVYVSNWGGRRPRPGDTTVEEFPVVLSPRTGIPISGTVSVYDGAAKKVSAEIEVGLHPSALALDSAHRRLYVANANSDSISVIDTATDRVVRTVEVGLFRKAPLGSSPNALAISADGRMLYVANGANNAIAVVDLERASEPVTGFIPTGWYPTAVLLAPGENRIYVASGYGFGSIAPAREAKGRSYRDRAGVVSIIDLPKRVLLRASTRQVLRNRRAWNPSTRGRAGRDPIPMQLGDASPIRHVFYIIKENRTYDQVFGDIKQGNGDESLAQFGREATPNHHALAEQFVLLDNFYAAGDQSALGHRWCTQGYASDWVFKYGNGRNDQNPMLFAPTDFLWDVARANHKTARSYGERGLNKISPENASWTDIYNDWKQHTHRVSIQPRTLILGLRDIYAPTYPAFETKVPDQYRVEEFLREFREFERNGNLPDLVVMLLPADHTHGTAPGYPTPRAALADNDLALGRVVEAISKSRYWKESAIFVTEDAAQDGLDHVDGHRTIALVMSPYTRRRVTDSTFYTTVNMYRTIEQILGLPPQNQFDLAAEPMFSAFTAEPDFAAYTALPNRIPLDEMNPPLKALAGLQRELAEESARMDFSEPDAAPEDDLNRAIWHSVKGDQPYPDGKKDHNSR